MNKDIYAILGYIAGEYDNKVNLNLVNAYLRDYDLPALTQDTLKDYVNEISKEDSEANRIYTEIKTSPNKLNVVLGYVDEQPNTLLLNIQGRKIRLPQSEVKQIVAIVDELQQASPSHQVPWGKVKKACLEQELYFSNTRDFRDIILRQLDIIKSQPTLEKTPNLVSSVTRSLVNEFGLLNARKRSLQNDQKVINRAKRDLLDQALLREEVINALQEPIQITVESSPVAKVKPKDTALFVVLSDLHVGALVRSKGEVIYNKDITKQRLDKYLERIKKQIELDKPSTVYIVNLGDLIENIQMRKNQGFETELTLGQQIKYGSELVGGFLVSLATLYPNINFDYRELEGNHDRFSPSKNDEIPQDGASLVATTIIDVATKNIKNVEVNYLEDQYRSVINAFDTNVLFVHGDRDKLSSDTLLGKMSTFVNKPLDIIVGGHLHSLQAREVGNNKYILQSGSIIGEGSYSNSLGVSSGASQLMITVSDEGIEPHFVTNL